MTQAQALNLFEEATGIQVDGWDDHEIHMMIESVRKVRSAKTEDEAISTIDWIGHSESDLKKVVAKIQNWE